jgi:hypothetical protein
MRTFFSFHYVMIKLASLPSFGHSNPSLSGECSRTLNYEGLPTHCLNREIFPIRGTYTSCVIWRAPRVAHEQEGGRWVGPVCDSCL